MTVGRAVALLHVVRHGLRAQELWSLLAALEAYTSAQEKVRCGDLPEETPTLMYDESLCRMYVLLR